MVPIVIIPILRISTITTVINSIIVTLTSIVLLLLSFPVPLLNFGSSFLTAFPNRTTSPSSPRAPASASSSPVARTYAPVPPTSTLMVMIPFIVPFAGAPPSIRALFVAPMPDGAPTSASAAAAPSPVTSEQLAPQLPADPFQVHEVAVSTTVARVLLVLPASGFTKVRHRRKVDDDWTASIKSSGEITKGIGSEFLLSELDVDIADHVVSQVVTHVEALDLAVLAELLKQVLVELLKVLLHGARIDWLALCIDAGGNHVGTLIHIGEEEGGADAGFGVKTRAAVAMPARPDLEVEGAIHPVLLRPKNRR